MSQVFVSWSGGKDCCLAFYRAMKSGHNVRYLASMMTEHTGRLWPHLLTPHTLEMQAKAMGIPLNMFTVIFAMARTVGWVAHWLEMMGEDDQRISRPRQVYTGPARRDLVNLDKR